MKKLIPIITTFFFLLTIIPTNAYFTWKPKGWGYTRTYAMSEEEQEDRLSRLINIYREKRNIPVMVRDMELDRVADKKMKRVVACPKELRHDACGQNAFKELHVSGIQYEVGRENLAHVVRGNEYHTFRMWLDSVEGHREALLSDCNRMGISADVEESGTFFVFICIKE